MTKIILLAALILSVFYSNGQQFKLISNSGDTTVFSHQLELKPLIYKTIDGVQYVDFSRMYEITTLNKDLPQLPKMTTSIAVPATGYPVFTVQYGSYSDIENVEVLPSKGNLKRNVDPSTLPYVFGQAYEMDEFYPGELVKFSGPFVSRDMRGMSFSFLPYQYNPVSKTLRVYHDIEIVLTIDKSREGHNEIKELPAATQTKKLNRALFLNGAETLRYTPKEEVGDLLIVCPAEMDSVVQVLANWKNQKGIKTKVVHTAETGMGVTNIKNYISNYYQQNADFLYLLLVGDQADIPAYTYGESYGEQLWSDSYYGQLTSGDNYPELFVGRFSGNLQEVATMVKRTIEYEKNPATGNWMQKAIGIASQEGAGFGYNGMSDWQHARAMGSELLAASYVDVFEFYEGSQGGNDAPGNPNSTMVSTALNDGVGLLNYTGHGDLNFMVTSNFTSTSVTNLNNQGKYPWVISVACNNGTFTNSTCISEKWLRASKNGSPTGAISACGSSILMAWTQPMKTQKELSSFIANADPQNIKKSLGGIFYNSQMKMLEQYPGLDGDEVMQTWIFFGDPTVEIRNQETMAMNVTHVSQIQQTETALIINCDTENALISISQNNVFLAKGTIVAGVANITLPSLTSNLPLTVTATKQNYRPYQGSIQVGNGPLGINKIAKNDYQIFPNPASKHVQVIFTSLSAGQIDLLDATGKVLKTRQVKSGVVNELISLDGIAKGMYQVVIWNGSERVVEKLVVE